MKLTVVSSHPVQYHAPLYRELAQRCDLRVFYAYRPDAMQQGREGFDTAFEWDTDLLGGYEHEFLRNRARDPRTDRFNGCDTPEIGERLRAGGFDAVMVTGWNLRCYWQAVVACRRAGLPVIVRGDSQLATPRSFWTRAIKTLAYPWMLKAFDAFAVVGQRNRDYLRHYGVAESRIFDSPHAVDTDFFARSAAVTDIAAVRRRLQTPEGHALLLYAGKFVAFKRISLLLDAAQRLKQRGRAIHVALVGAGPEAAALRIQVAAAGLSACFTGFLNQNELPAVYAAADLLVLPSDGRETWGLVVNEAFACGTPTVVADAVGSAPDLIRPGLSGETFSGSAPDLVDAIDRVLERGKTAEVRSALQSVSQRHSIAAAATGILNAAEAVRTCA